VGTNWSRGLVHDLRNPPAKGRFPVRARINSLGSNLGEHSLAQGREFFCIHDAIRTSFVVVSASIVGHSQRKSGGVLNFSYNDISKTICIMLDIRIKFDRHEGHLQNMAAIGVITETTVGVREDDVSQSSVAQAQPSAIHLVEELAESRVITGVVQVSPVQEQDDRWEEESWDIDQWG
jgi:hypothetical protein